MDLPSESNTLAASAIFLGSMVVDSFTARDPRQSELAHEGPTAMRNTAIVLIACLAAPPIRQWMVFEQRLVIAVLLLAVALLGWHEMGKGTRIADAVYLTLMLGTCILTFWMGKVDKNIKKERSKDAPPYLRREALVSLAMSMLFYSSMRLLRSALRHSDVARQLRVDGTAYDGTPHSTAGYAYASSATVAGLSFGAAAGIGVACVLGANKELREHGTSAATLVLTTAAFAQLTGAFVSTMGTSEQLVHLPAIFSAGACSNARECAPAIAARRFAIVSGNAAALWLNGFGTLLMAFAPTIRLRSRVEMESVQRNFELTVYAVAFASICVFALTRYLSFTGAEALTDYAAVGAVLAVLVTAFIDSLFGALAFVVAVGADVIQLWSAYGTVYVFGHFTHCCNAVMLFLLALYVVLTSFVDFLWRWLPQQVVDIVDTITGLLTVLGTSIATLLFLGTTALYASYDGQLVDDAQFRAADNRYERTTAAMIAEHWLPVLVWLPLYSCRCEVELLSMRARAVAWYSAVALPATIWLVVLGSDEIAVAHAQDWYSTAPFVLSVLIVAVIPWMVVVWA